MRRGTRFTWGSALAGVLLAGFLFAPFAAAADSPFLRYDSSSNIEIDLHRIVDDLAPLVLAGAGDDSASGRIRDLMDLTGLPALDRLSAESRSSLQDMDATVTVSLDRGRPAGLLGALADVPTGRFTFGRYLREGEAAVIFSRQNAAGDLRALGTWLERPETQGALSSASPKTLAGLSLWESHLAPQLLPDLRGELDVIVFPPAEGADNPKPGVVMALAVADGPALRDKLLTAVGSLAGEEAVEEMRSAEGEKAGDFRIYPLHADMVYAVSPDFLVVSTDAPRLRKMVSRSGRGLEPVEGRTYLRVDADLVLPLVAAHQGESPAVMDSILATLRASSGGSLGTFEAVGAATPDAFRMTLHGPGSLLTAQYALLEAGIRQGLQEKARQARSDLLRRSVTVIDRTMAAYGADHGGLFPETLDHLVEEGYLDRLPDLQEVPLGHYLEGGYSYVPLLNDDGWVAGYYYFVYGGGAHTGFDVFTPGNLADPEHFVIGSDGEPDGVISFAYDGVAQGQVEAWRERN